MADQTGSVSGPCLADRSLRSRGEKCVWQGEPVVAVVADSRAQAEDAIERIAIEWEELPAIASIGGRGRVGSGYRQHATR